MIEFGENPDTKLYKVKWPDDLYRYHRERASCAGLFPYSYARPLICPGCRGRWQGNVVERTRRRVRDWLLAP